MYMYSYIYTYLAVHICMCIYIHTQAEHRRYYAPCPGSCPMYWSNERTSFCWSFNDREPSRRDILNSESSSSLIGTGPFGSSSRSLRSPRCLGSDAYWAPQSASIPSMRFPCPCAAFWAGAAVLRGFGAPLLYGQSGPLLPGKRGAGGAFRLDWAPWHSYPSHPDEGL